MKRSWYHTGREHFEVYCTRVPPEQWGEVEPEAYPITIEEWNQLVAADDDLVWVDGRRDRWRFRSHPEGPALRFEQGAVVLTRDDALTIEKMVDLAERLGAFVIDENGQHYQRLQGEIESREVHGGEAQGVQPPPAAVAGRVVVDTEEERLRKRQALAVIIAGLIATVGLGAWILRDGGAFGHLVAAVVALALAVWAMVRHRASVFVLERAGSTATVTRRSTRSTADAVSRVELEPGALSALELVWFPLEYPSSTVIELHVRVEGIPWLILFAGHHEERARSRASELGRRLLVPVHDRTGEAPVTDMPSSYRLTAQEKRGTASTRAVWIVPMAFALFGAAFWIAGFVWAGAVFLGMTVVSALGLLRSRPRRVAEKYQRWLD